MKTKKNTCVECRYCGEKIDARKKTHEVCTHSKRALPANVTSRKACGDFKPPKPTEHWGA